MFKTFETLDDLMVEVNKDRTIEGEGASTANRFPVRFVLFDNFRDCCSFVNELSHLPNLAMQRLEEWMDSDYPDTMLTHLNLEKHIQSLIKENPTEYRIIMPFSELARFYNNTPEKAEFNTLITTIKAFDTSKSGYLARQRVYIPIVGLEGKMQHFRDDNQSFIWYFRNPDRQQDYRLILTDNTTYGVSGLETKYTIAPEVIEWLKCWKYPELKENIISTSHSIFSHRNYAQPDNAFSYCVCHNAYEFLTKGLRLDVDCIEYREEDSIYWDQLAKMVDIEGFHFDKFFREQFGIYDLSDYNVFYQQWYEHKQPFMRWLLAKYYTYRFCNEGYICRVLNAIDAYNDSTFTKSLSTLIFHLDSPENYLEERLIGLQIAAKNGVEPAPEVQKYLVEQIKDFAQKHGVLSALPYVSCMSTEEKALIIEWYSAGKIDKEQLKSLYPDLYYYLQPTIAETPEPWVLDYIDKYKQAKVQNVYTPDIQNYIASKNANALSHFTWSNKFSTTKTIMSSRVDIGHFVWIDGLGLDWVSFIQQLVKERELDGYYLNETLVATAKLPTRTDINKADIESMSGSLMTKIGDLDEVAHTNSSSRAYPRFIIDDLSMLRKAVNKMLDNHPNEKIAIVSDHGMTYLSQLCEGKNLAGFTSDHFGRVAIHNSKTNPVSDDCYVLIQDKKTVCALRHESLMKKIAYNTGCHGGCTPEEQLVPILIISPTKEAASWIATQRTFDLQESDPVFEVDIIGMNCGTMPMLEYNGKYYSVSLASGTIYRSERIQLDPYVKKVILHIGLQTKEFSITVKMAVQEDDPFAF